MFESCKPSLSQIRNELFLEGTLHRKLYQVFCFTVSAVQTSGEASLKSFSATALPDTPSIPSEDKVISFLIIRDYFNFWSTGLTSRQVLSL